MADFRFGVWNIEWMNDLFSSDGAVSFKDDDERIRGPKSGNTVKQRRESIAGVIEELEVEVLVIVEGANRATEIQLFFDTDVTGDWSCDVQPTKGSSQVLAIAVRTDTGKFSADPFTRIDTSGGQGESRITKACEDFVFDVDNDGIDEFHRFERLPIYVELNLADSSKCRVLGLHLKSKGIFSALEWSQWWKVADANRKKLLAQCSQIRRKFLDYYLTDAETKDVPLIVCGDINDGPGFDASEKRLLGSGIERLMGSVWKPDLNLGNALFDALKPDHRWEIDLSSIHTTSFKDPIFQTYRKAWIDHVLYSLNQPSRFIEDAVVHEKMASGEKIWKEYPYASDHFPITVAVSTPQP